MYKLTADNSYTTLNKKDYHLPVTHLSQSNSTLQQLFNNPPEEPFTTWTDTPEQTTPYTSFLEVIKASHNYFNTDSVATRANQKATKVPAPDDEVIEYWSNMFQKDPINTLTTKFNEHKHTRVNIDNIINDPDFQLATTQLQKSLRASMELLDPIFPSEFIPDPTAAAVRPKMTAIQPAVNALAWISYTKGECLYITTKAFLNTTHKKHGSEIHHRQKPDEDLGRLLYDYSNIKKGTPVNGQPSSHDHMIKQCQEKYGILAYPTVCDFINIYWEAQQIFAGLPIYIAKTDVRRAYHCIGWTPEGSLLLSLKISNTHHVVPLTCGFGKIEGPYAFGPISAWLDYKHLCRMKQSHNITKPLCATFVDDTVTFGSMDFLNTEVPASEKQIQQSIHQTAVNPDKRRIADTEDVLGIRFNTTTNKIGLSYKAYLKLVYVYFNILPVQLSITTLLPLILVQTVASLAHHYGQYIPLLRCSGSIYYQALQGTAILRRFNTQQVQLTQLWRDYLYYAYNHATILTTTMHDIYYNDPTAGSIAPVPPGAHAYSDSTMNTLGLYVPEHGWCAVTVKDIIGTTTVTPTIAHLEFLAFLLTYLLIKTIQPHQPHYHIYIDNQNALAWASGRISTNDKLANILTFTNSCLQTACKTPQTRSYIASADNINADSISRSTYKNSEQLTQYFMTPRLLIYCKLLFTKHDVTVSEIVAETNTVWDNGDSKIFSTSKISNW